MREYLFLKTSMERLVFFWNIVNTRIFISNSLLIQLFDVILFVGFNLIAFQNCPCVIF